MNVDHLQHAVVSKVESQNDVGEIQLAARLETLSPELLNLVSGGDIVPCW